MIRIAKWPLMATMLSALLWSAPAEATQGSWRVTFFEGIGRNETINNTDMGSAFNSTCLISVTNNSSATQEGVVTFDEVALVGNHTNDNLPSAALPNGSIPANPCVSATCPGSNVDGFTPSTPQTFSFSLAANASVTYIYLYDAFPAFTNGAQNLRCAGSIRARDSVAGSQGFIVASGIITSFSQTSRGYYVAGAGPTNAQQRSAITQVQSSVLINQGRPF
jgi:hypothetical protein